MESNNEPTTGSPMTGEPPAPRRKTGSNAKWFAIVLMLVVIVAAFGAANFVKSPNTSTAVSVVSVPSGTVSVGTPVTLSLTAAHSYKEASFFFGDGSVATSAYSGSDAIAATHVYQNPGTYYIVYSVNYGNGATYTNSNSLVRVTATTTTYSQDESLGVAQTIANLSSAQEINNFSNIFNPGANVTLGIGYAQSPANPSYSVYSQTVSVMFYSNTIMTKTLPYVFNATQGAYVLAPSNALLTLSDLSSGFYVIALTTYTSIIGPNGQLMGPTYTSTVYTDIPVFSNANIYTAPSVSSTLTNAEVVSAGYKTFDGQIAYDTVSNEILDNTYLWLDNYNGSSSSSFVPILASQLPSIANGQINNHTLKRTVPSMGPAGYANGPNVNYTYAPYQVYSFTIRSNATWQDGTPVTAYDVAYAFIRDMLFVNGEPGTPGWIQAQALLPNYVPFSVTTSNSFYNLITNITWNNATNTVTFYFQQPESPDFVYEIFAASGAYIMDPTWLAAWGGAITWTPAGFEAYQAEASTAGYDTHFINNIFADGPYELAYAVPGTEVVLQANPNYNPPGPWFPKPSISVVTILYLSSFTTSYLLLKSGGAQFGGIPSSSWSEAVGLQKAGTVDIQSFPTLSIYWYNFNAYVNMTMASSVFTGINMPSALFSVPLVRKAFAYAYNYAYYLKDQEGNPQYPSTIFAYGYAGMLPAGMLYSQSIAQLNNVTTGVPYYNMTLAIDYWHDFLHSPDAAKMGISSSGMYKGAMLDIPIITFSPDPQDEEGATTWGTSLAIMMGYGASNFGQFPATPVPFAIELGYQVFGQNPMPIYELGWAPDYPYPSDYMGPMGDPAPAALYPGSNAMFPQFISTVNSSEAKIMDNMSEIFNESQTAANPARAESLYHSLNEWLINLTFYVYLFQAPEFIISASNINQAKLTEYQENVMIGGGGDLLYNLISYT
jgi:peptide/nickel transport system substrate-binding protein